MEVFDQLEKKGLKPKAYSKESARQIAENLAPYIVGYGRVGEQEGKAELFGAADQNAPNFRICLRASQARWRLECAPRCGTAALDPA